MSLLVPTVSVEKVTDISVELLRALGARAILLDVDNTLALHGSQIPLEGTVEWSWKIRRNGFHIILMSNNFQKRVEPFAAQYGLPFQSMSMKPFPRAYRLAVARLGAGSENAVVVGDQIFTDVLGANLNRMKSILLVPAHEENSVGFRIRRYLERGIRKKIEKMNGGSGLLHKG